MGVAFTERGVVLYLLFCLLAASYRCVSGRCGGVVDVCVVGGGLVVRQ